MLGWTKNGKAGRSNSSTCDAEGQADNFSDRKKQKQFTEVSERFIGLLQNFCFQTDRHLGRLLYAKAFNKRNSQR